MLVNFSVTNYLSFKEKQTLSLVADSFKELSDNLFIPQGLNDDEKFLKSVAIYGHNSHGKSNLLKAFKYLQESIFSSFTRGQFADDIAIEPFRLNTSMLSEPSTFELCIIVNAIKFRYKVALTRTAIVQEGLYYSQPKIRENYLFERAGQEIRVSRQWNKDNDGKVEAVLPFAKPTILFLSVLLSQQSVTYIQEIGGWLRNNQIISDINFRELHAARTIYSNPDYRSLILKFIEAGDLGFTSIFDKLDKIYHAKPSFEMEFLKVAFEKEIRDFELYTIHPVFNESKKMVDKIEFELLKNESAGSIKYFTIVCLLAHAIRHSQLILIDELDSRLHSLLLEMLVEAFHRPEINPLGAQLIFTTHNTQLLGDRLRRDQMVIVEKNEWGESSVFRSHTVENPIKIGKSLEKEYRKGNLGGVSKKIKKNLGPSLFDEIE